MGDFSESKQTDPQAPLVRAIAYYRHSVQDGQEASLAIQQDHVRRWATETGVEIIREFCDAGPAQNDFADRPAFTEMLDDWIKQRSDFEYVLCLDASRWGPVSKPRNRETGKRNLWPLQKTVDLHLGWQTQR